MPPWPKITIFPGGSIAYDPEPETCTTESASICSTTTIYSATITGTETKTTFSSTSHTCETVFGCEVTNSNTATKTVSASGCPATPTGIPPDGCPQNAFVYPANPANVGEIPTLLQNYASTYQVVELSDFVAFYWVPLLDQQTMNALQSSPDVDTAYYYEQFYANTGYIAFDDDDDQMQVPNIAKRDATLKDDGLYHYDIGYERRFDEEGRHLNNSYVTDVEEASLHFPI